MNDNNVRMKLLDEMEEAGIVTREGKTASYFDNGREYLLLVNVVDITGWQKETDEV